MKALISVLVGGIFVFSASSLQSRHPCCSPTRAALPMGYQAPFGSFGGATWLHQGYSVGAGSGFVFTGMSPWQNGPAGNGQMQGQGTSDGSHRAQNFWALRESRLEHLQRERTLHQAELADVSARNQAYLQWKGGRKQDTK